MICIIIIERKMCYCATTFVRGYPPKNQHRVVMMLNHSAVYYCMKFVSSRLLFILCIRFL